MNKETNSIKEKYISRDHFLSVRRSISTESRSLLDAALFSNTAALPQFKEAKVLLCYYPINGEPNIIPLARHALSLGKKVAFPISHVKEKRLSFHVINDISCLKIGAYGIPEPPIELPEVTDFSYALCIVPALAFDANGYRVGYGKGYYDRFLSGYSQTKLGIVYADFILDRVPRGRFDRHVDILVTERGIKLAASEKKSR